MAKHVEENEMDDPAYAAARMDRFLVEKHNLILEAEQLKATVSMLVRALKLVKSDGMLASHAGHWDSEGTHGANCPVCQAQITVARHVDLAIKVAVAE